MVLWSNIMGNINTRLTLILYLNNDKKWILQTCKSNLYQGLPNNSFAFHSKY